MGILFARTVVTCDDQRRLGPLGAFDLAVSHLRDAIVESQRLHPGRPFTVALEYQDDRAHGGDELTRHLPTG